LVSGPEGIKYFTIRPVFDTGLTPATQARDKMIRGPKRHAQITLGTPWEPAALAALSEVHDHWAIAAERGLAVRHLRLPPGAPRVLQHVEDSTSLFAFVLSGSAQAGGQAVSTGQTMGRWESVFATREEILTITAGQTGAEVVVLHVPPTEPEYQPKP
jgi:redox-sensitive bicupin YhaK (pirin superfamily)